MHHGHVLRRGVSFRQAASSDSGCPPTDLGGSTLQDGNSNGPLALCLYANGGHCTYLGGTVQANLSGNDPDCPARLIDGGDGCGIGVWHIDPSASTNPNFSFTKPPAQLNYKHFFHRHEQPGYARSAYESGQYHDRRDFGKSFQHNRHWFAFKCSTYGIHKVYLRNFTPDGNDESGLRSCPKASREFGCPLHKSITISLRKASLAGGAIAGIAIGTLALILLLLALLFCVRRRYRRILDPVIHVELAAESRTTLPSAGSEKTSELNAHLNGMAEEETSRSTTSPSVPVQLRQEYLRNRIGEARRKLIIMNDAVSRSAADDDVGEETTLEGALRQIQSQQEQIGRLESQLQSQWALGLSDEPPPQYLQ
ncbi:hypothetical protein B0H13DRAFT_1853902 [Mycena leptocephala]|nr:hypothetical protein B0H13DRAFT_1853902 [Mycena leptocephala]